MVSPLPCLQQLDESKRDEVLIEAASWSAAHSREALPEQAVLVLETGAAACHLLGTIDGETVYAQGQPTDGLLEFVAMADRMPSELLDAALACAAEHGRDLAIWTRHVSAESLPPPCRTGLRLDREILRLHGPLTGSLVAGLPDDVSISCFRPGRDEAEFLELNARAFAGHPEQGAMTRADLSLRFEQPWFDPGGFLVLRQQGTMVAFCWTKVHREAWGDIGEIYVIGVDPELAGHGVGRLAVSAGLDHLAALGLAEVMLYVEATNEPAIGLYRSLGLTESWRDRRWTTGS